MAPEDELLSMLQQSRILKRQAIYTLHQNLLIRNEYKTLVSEARAVRQRAQITCESALRVREDTARKLSAIPRALQPPLRNS